MLYSYSKYLILLFTRQNSRITVKNMFFRALRENWIARIHACAIKCALKVSFINKRWNCNGRSNSLGYNSTVVLMGRVHTVLFLQCRFIIDGVDVHINSHLLCVLLQNIAGRDCPIRAKNHTFRHVLSCYHWHSEDCRCEIPHSSCCDVFVFSPACVQSWTQENIVLGQFVRLIVFCFMRTNYARPLSF